MERTHQLRHDHEKAAGREHSGSDWSDGNRLNRPEEALRRDRPEDRAAKASVGQHVEQWVRQHHHEREQREPAISAQQPRDHSAQHGERNRMRRPAMTELIRVRNAEHERDDVRVGQHRQRREREHRDERALARERPARRHAHRDVTEARHLSPKAKGADSCGADALVHHRSTSVTG